MLNDAKIRAAKPREKAYKLTDSHRLYLLVKPGGSKLWKWSYAYAGKQKTMHLGIYPTGYAAGGTCKKGRGTGTVKRWAGPCHR